MGSRWEVWAWVKNDPTQTGSGYGEDYVWERVPCRQNIFSVLFAAWRVKRHAGLVKVEWR
jgi:hypothetical protein